MSTPRLATHIEVTGLIRRAESLGGGGMVLARGDREAGTVMIVLLERGVFHAVLERALASAGGYRWQIIGADEIERKQSLNNLIASRRRIDPDLWVLELDIPQAERFAAQFIAEG